MTLSLRVTCFINGNSHGRMTLLHGVHAPAHIVEQRYTACAHAPVHMGDTIANMDGSLRLTVLE